MGENVVYNCSISLLPPIVLDNLFAKPTNREKYENSYICISTLQFKLFKYLKLALELCLETVFFFLNKSQHKLPKFETNRSTVKSEGRHLTS